MHVLNNDNKAVENVWALINPANQEWAEGRVEIIPNGEKEYQVISHDTYADTICRIKK